MKKDKTQSLLDKHKRKPQITKYLWQLNPTKM